MIRRFLAPILALWLLIDGVGCNSESRSPTDGRIALNANDTSAFTPISQSVARASSLTLYEGLPHPVWDTDYEKELATKKTVRLHDYPFYERPLDVSESDREELRGLSASADSYFSFS